MKTTLITIRDLDTFLDAYIATALWSSNDESDDSGGKPMDASYDASDIAPETLATMRADCERFLAEHGDVIEAAITTGNVRCGPDFDAWGHAAHDFWLTRNGHGAGFWDGDWPEPHDVALTKAARKFGSIDLYVGDDGQIHG